MTTQKWRQKGQKWTPKIAHFILHTLQLTLPNFAYHGLERHTPLPKARRVRKTFCVRVLLQNLPTFFLHTHVELPLKKQSTIVFAIDDLHHTCASKLFFQPLK